MSLWPEHPAVSEKPVPSHSQRPDAMWLVQPWAARKVPIPMQSHYSSSKYALEAMVEAIRLEMRHFGVQATLIEPGDTRTGFTVNRQFYDNNSSAYKEICAVSVGKMERDERNGRSPQTVADVAMKLAGRKNHQSGSQSVSNTNCLCSWCGSCRIRYGRKFYINCIFHGNSVTELENKSALTWYDRIW